LVRLARSVKHRTPKDGAFSITLSSHTEVEEGKIMKMGFVRRLLFLLFLCGSISLFSQNQTPVRDDRALMIVQTAIVSMGAANSESVIQDCVLIGTNDSDSEKEPHKDFTWTIAGNEFRYDVTSAKGSGYFVSGHGKPANVSNGKVTAIREYVARASLPYYLPGLLLSRELASSNYSISYVGTASVNGRQAVQVHLSDGSDKIAALVTPQDWYFDLSTGIPLRVEFRIPPNENPKDFVIGTFDFSGFQTVSGMRIPFKISFFQEKHPLKRLRFKSVAFNVGVSASIFDAPEGGQ
jgi:hypothetical protein